MTRSVLCLDSKTFELQRNARDARATMRSTPASASGVHLALAASRPQRCDADTVECTHRLISHSLTARHAHRSSPHPSCARLPSRFDDPTLCMTLMVHLCRPETMTGAMNASLSRRCVLHSRLPLPASTLLSTLLTQHAVDRLIASRAGLFHLVHRLLLRRSNVKCARRQRTVRTPTLLPPSRRAMLPCPTLTDRAAHPAPRILFKRSVCSTATVLSTRTTTLAGFGP